MKKLLLILLLLALPACGYQGSWKIDDTFVMYRTTADPTDGTVISSATPTYRVYEDSSDTALLNGSFARVDSSNTDSLWRASITLSAGNGFEKGKNYAAFAQVVISSETYETVIPFQVEAEVDANIVSDKTGYSLANDAVTAAVIAADAIGSSEIATGAIDADAIAADAVGSSEIATDALGAAEIAANAIGASELATDAIGSDELAASAVTEIQSGLSTAANLTILDASVNVIEATLATPANFMANVASLAIEGNVEAHVTTSLNTYDPPTKAELDSGFAALNDISTTDLASATAALATLINALNDLSPAQLASATAELETLINALNDIDGTGLTVDLNADQSSVTVGTVTTVTNAVITDATSRTASKATGFSTLTSAQVATLIASGTEDIRAVSDEFGGGGGGDATLANQVIMTATLEVLETSVARVLSTSAAIEAATSGYRFTTVALENAPSGDISGVSDWTSGEKNQMRRAMGITGASAEIRSDGIVQMIYDWVRSQ